MSPPGSQAQWYLARDGQQFGPISDAELGKFIELGHLQPTDLLWREGFPDWRPALVVFPPQNQTDQRGPAGAGPAAGPVAQPSQRRQPSRARPISAEAEDDVDDGRKRRGFGRLLAASLILCIAGGMAWFAYGHRERLADYVALFRSSEPASTSLDVADRKALDVPPFADLRGSAEVVDAKMRKAALWQVMKREFPDWYTQRLDEIVAMGRENKDDAAIAQHLASKLVELRRREVVNGLSATLPRLKSVVEAYRENLARLRRESSSACFSFISQGEVSPVIVDYLRGSKHTAHLQAQMTAVFEAIAEGRKQPRVYPRPTPAHHELLVANLRKMGWTQEDMQLFSDERALSKAAPEKVCQVVTDWFTAQLTLTDPEAQTRLLSDSVRPIFAG
jgi:hypothetical protein